MLNPILSFSATRRMRTFRMMAVLAASVLVMLGVALPILGGLFSDQISITQMRSGYSCCVALFIVQFVLIVLIAPAMTSGAIAGERERQTLELLLVTNTGPLRIVTGKVLESLAFLVLLMFSGMPVMCLTMLTGGVTILQILTGEGFLLCCAFGAVCVGVFASSLTRGTVLSTILCYLMILAIGALTTLPAITGYPQRITDVLYDPKLYKALTPFSAVLMISPLLLMNPGYGLFALVQSVSGLLTQRLNERGWGRILATWMTMNRAGLDTVTLLSGGMIVLAGFLLMLLAALRLRNSRG